MRVRESRFCSEQSSNANIVSKSIRKIHEIAFDTIKTTNFKHNHCTTPYALRFPSTFLNRYV